VIMRVKPTMESAVAVTTATSATAFP